jgi:hypothetical protein
MVLPKTQVALGVNGEPLWGRHQINQGLR